MTLPEVFAALDRAIATTAAQGLPALLGRLAEANARLAREVPAEALPRLRAALTEADSIALSRLTTPTHNAANGDPNPEAEPEWLTPPEAAAIFKVTPRWLNRATKGRGFRRQESRRTIRYEKTGLRRWLAKRI